MEDYGEASPASGSRRLGMGLYFYPRGGSAQVARYLIRALARHGWTTELISGSLGDKSAMTNAAAFFDHDHLITAPYDKAVERHEAGENPMTAPFPHHASYEDRDGVADKVFGHLDEAEARLQVDAWAELISGSDWAEADILHLHHLTPMHLAAERCVPHVPRITHLHGTELKFIALAMTGEGRAQAHALDWVERMRQAARNAAHTICISEHDRDLAIDLLGIAAESITVLPNGVDTQRFVRHETGDGERLANWRRFLVEDCQGWDVSGRPGSIAYDDSDLSVFTGTDGKLRPVLIFVGRFLGFKRVPLLVRAYARARREFGVEASLVIWGGSPGEWEGEHPCESVRRVGVESVFFAGWRGHEDLPIGLGSSDLLVAPSVNEPFGQVYLEAMSCGLPVIATRSGGPLGFVNTEEGRPNGWLVDPDDEGALATAIATAVNDESERRRRGVNAYEQVRAKFSWDALAERFISTYSSVLDGRSVARRGVS